jgi:hypothetical protein
MTISSDFAQIGEDAVRIVNTGADSAAKTALGAYQDFPVTFPELGRP